VDDYLCGAKTRSGKPCKNQRFVGTGRCKFHGGLSTGPKDKNKLIGNKNAVGNCGGGAPKGNKNAAKNLISTILWKWGRRKLHIQYVWEGNKQKEIGWKIV
jgi:hypothetical protein